MFRTIVLWGVVCGACLCVSPSLQAASLDWSEGYQQARHEAQAMLMFTASDSPQLSKLQSSPSLTSAGLMKSLVLPADAPARVENNVPVLALPESGTLILLGLGLAGLASLIRKKKN